MVEPVTARFNPAVDFGPAVYFGLGRAGRTGGGTMAAYRSDPLFWNMIAGAVLLSGIIAMGSGFISHLLVQPTHLAENAYPIEVAESSAATGTDKPAGPEPIAPMLAAADVAAGEKLAKKCAACHSFEKDGPNKIGPNLWAILGRDIASVGGFGYSEVLVGIDGNWEYASINQFLYKPKAYAAGTKMSFPGMKKAEERANLIGWLRTLSDSPVPLPE